MPTTFKSPFATSFKSAMNRGTSYTTAVVNIAKKNNTTTTNVWQSLYKAGLCWRQKFNGQWIYFPTSFGKSTSKTWKNAQFECWQWFCEFAIAQGFCTPQSMKNACGSQKDFMNFCKKFWGKQFSVGTSTKKSSSVKKSVGVKKSATTKTRKTTTSSTRKSYKFPVSKSTSRTRRFNRAA